ELKTPVTSISGLLQAVRDGVVKEEEAKEFIEISLNETTKMKKMVEDLLAFNSFAANTVPLSKQKYKLNHMIDDMLHEWEVLQQEEINISVDLLHEDVFVEVDKVRSEQIMMNLLNNAKQAMEGRNEKKIQVELDLKENIAIINVTDHGAGIPED